MLRLARFCLAAIIYLGLQSTVLSARPTAPEWVRELVSQPASFDYADANAVVLLDDEVIQGADDGTFNHRIRWAVRILTREGTIKAKASLYYYTRGSKVKSVRAWIVMPDGKVTICGDAETVDQAALSGYHELYDDQRVRRIDASHNANVGSVFAYEAIYEERSIYSQMVWYFSDDLPVERSRIKLTMPDGWTVKAHTFNHEALAAVESGRSKTWELTQLRAIKAEAARPSSAAIRPWIGIDVQPPAAAKGCIRQSQSSWQAISSYWTPKYDEASQPDNTIKAKADELAAGSNDLRTKIARLCLYAQKTNYVSIALNSAAGGGYIPQPASKVFRCNYGDCKDKATLLRALLSTQGIISYPLIVYSGDFRHVRPEWPAATQFNHCILAIQVPEAFGGSAMVKHPKYGSLMIFDPTDPYVPFGELPQHDSGGYGILLAGEGGGLIALPAITPSCRNQTAEFVLKADGSIAGSVQVEMSGDAARGIRSGFRDQLASDFNKELTQKLGLNVASPQTLSVECDDAFDLGSFKTRTSFTAVAYGRTMQNSFMAFRPGILSVSSALILQKEKRTLPVVVSPIQIVDSTEITLPSGFVIEELPSPVEIDSTHGRYTRQIRITKQGHLLLKRSLQMQAATVPVQNYESIRSFLQSINDAENSSVILRRTSGTESLSLGVSAR